MTRSMKKKDKCEGSKKVCSVEKFFLKIFFFQKQNERVKK